MTQSALAISIVAWGQGFMEVTYSMPYIEWAPWVFAIGVIVIVLCVRFLWRTR